MSSASHLPTDLSFSFAYWPQLLIGLMSSGANWPYDLSWALNFWLVFSEHKSIGSSGFLILIINVSESWVSEEWGAARAALLRVTKVPGGNGTRGCRVCSVESLWLYYDDKIVDHFHTFLISVGCFDCLTIEYFFKNQFCLATMNEWMTNQFCIATV